jgi:hypothetical protein
VANYQARRRDQLQELADGMSLSVSDLDGDGRVSEAWFRTGAETSFDDLDTNGYGGTTIENFAR